MNKSLIANPNHYLHPEHLVIAAEVTPEALFLNQEMQVQLKKIPKKEKKKQLRKRKIENFLKSWSGRPPKKNAIVCMPEDKSLEMYSQ